MSDKKLQLRLSDRLATIEEAGLKRAVLAPAGIDLSSNDYLCIASDDRLKGAAVLELNRSGVGSTGSRLLRGHRDVFVQVELEFARWKNTERALLFSSGYHANLGVLQTFVENNDVVFSDELNHASIIDAIRLTKARRVIFDHNNFDQLAEHLHTAKVTGQKFLVTESVFSMEGDTPPLDRYAKLCRETDTAMIIDEAHAVGMFGHDGNGLVAEFGIADDVFLTVNPAGKALGVSGAFVAGGTMAIEYLIQKARPFIFSTAPSPVVPAALLESIRILRADPTRREKLHSLAKYFRKLLAEFQIAPPADFVECRSPIVSLLIGENERTTALASELQSLGYDVRAIRPPTVAEGTSRLRISLNVGLTEEILRVFARTLKTVLDGSVIKAI